MLEEIDGDAARWLVVESTDATDESLLATVRVTTDSSSKSAIVDIMAVEESMQRRGLGTWTLQHVEHMMAGNGMKELIVELAECRTDVIHWLEKRQYKRIGGYLCEGLTNDNIPITMLQYQVRAVHPITTAYVG